MDKLDKILAEIKQDQSQGNVKITTKPLYEPTELRKFFLEVLTGIIRNRTGGEKELILNGEMKRAINIICQYLNRENQFLEHDGFSFDKGIWLYGAFGSGKTILMLAYREAIRVLFHEIVGFKTCVHMNEAFINVDIDTGKPNAHLGIKTFANKRDKIERIFDDLGEEETTVKHYGNKVCVMGTILSERYKGFPEVKTHITTNVSKSDLPELYGGRIDSRVYEMFNMIKLGGSKDSIDFRKI